MLENQEPQSETTEVKVTVEDKLMSIVIFPHNYLEVADAPVKPILDVFGLEPKAVGWYNEPTAEQVTIRQELVKLHKLVTEKDTDIKAYLEQIRQARARATEVEEYLDENWSDIDEEVREKLCEIFGIEESVTKTIKITVEGTIEITAPRGYDWDNIENDLNPCVEVEVTNSELESAGYGFSHDDTTIEEY